MLEAYRHHAQQRAALGIPALPLSAQQTAELIELIKSPPAGEQAFLVELLSHRVPAGVDDAAKVKASYLAAVAFGTETTPLISPKRATELLGTMLGGYNIHPLIELLDHPELGETAAKGLKHTLLMFDAFHDVEEKAKAGNPHAKAVLQSWAEVYQPPGGSRKPHRDRLQSPGRNQYRRFIARTGCNHAPGYPAARAGDAEKQAPRCPVRARSAPGLRVNQRPTRYCGGRARIFPIFRTSVLAACVWAGKSRRFSTTPWKTRAHCRLSLMLRR